MSVASYRYLSDDGQYYQVVLPSDFAAALGYTPALGSEPFLPGYVSPRYATYLCAFPPMWAPVVIQAPFSAFTLPQVVAVSGNTYRLKSTNGEQRFSAVNPQIMTISGPPGLAGAAGAAGATGANGTNGTNADIITVTGTITSAQLKAIFTTPVTLVPAQGAGKVINVINQFEKYNYGGTAYSGANDLNGTINGATTARMILSSHMTGVVNAYQAIPVTIDTTTNLENAALVATSAANYSLGNGTIDYSIDYRVVVA